MAHRFKTPAVPKWIKELEHDGYRNIYEFNLRNQNLHGVESLCGDWDGDLLIVGKDFAPADAVCNLVGGDTPRGLIYRHNDGDRRYGDIGLPTNRFLVELLRANGRSVSLDGSGNLVCGCLYVNACFLLRNDGKTSGELPNGWETPSNRVFEFVIKHMKSVRKIACLGQAPFEFVTNHFFGMKADWRSTLEGRDPIMVEGVAIYAQSHPGNYGVKNRLPIGTPMEKRFAITNDWLAMMRA